MKKVICLIGFLFAGSVSAATVLNESFDPMSAANWSVSNGVVLGTGSSEFFDGNALYFNGNGNRNRNAYTSGFDLSSGGDISFRLKVGGPNDTRLFEDADNGEDILFNYSTDNGASWLNLFTFDTENTLYRDTWGLATFVLTGSALTSNTMFQWEQARHSGSGWDHWAIDNVVIQNKVSSNVPEPSPLTLLVLSLLGLLAIKYQKKSSIVKSFAA